MKAAFCKETFIDEGDVDIQRILKRNNFSGVIISDHASRMSYAAPWRVGMTYALGYPRTALQVVENECV